MLQPIPILAEISDKVPDAGVLLFLAGIFSFLGISLASVLRKRWKWLTFVPLLLVQLFGIGVVTDMSDIMDSARRELGVSYIVILHVWSSIPLVTVASFWLMAARGSAQSAIGNRQSAIP